MLQRAAYNSKKWIGPDRRHTPILLRQYLRVANMFDILPDRVEYPRVSLDPLDVKKTGSYLVLSMRQLCLWYWSDSNSERTTLDVWKGGVSTINAYGLQPLCGLSSSASDGTRLKSLSPNAHAFYRTASIEVGYERELV